MTLEKVLKSVVFAGIFAIPFIPLIVANTLFFPFITGKGFAFRILVEVSAAAWLALALVSPVFRPRRSWVLATLALFVLVIGIADVFGANTLKSIWSNFERMEGWVTLAHLLVYFTVMYSMLRTEQVWSRLIHTSIGVSVIAGLYGILQLAGFLTINQGGVRLDATFGNATYLAVYMLFHLFLTALMWEKAWRSHTERVWLSVMYGGIMVLQGIILFFTATRGAILGALGGALLSALLLVIFARQSKNAWRASVAVIAGILVLVGGFFILKDTKAVTSVEPLERLASISLQETTVVSRFYNYGMAWEGFKERPLLGWGQENYNLVFNTYYDPRMYAQEPWFDRVHNIVFDWLIAGGLLGLLSYVGVLFAALLGVWRSGAFSVAERSIFTGLLAGYIFHNLFVFDNITSYIMFMMVLAYIAFRVADARAAQPLCIRALPHKLLPVVAVFAAIGLWGVAWFVNAQGLEKNRALINALIPKESPEAAVEAMEAVAAVRGFLGTQEVREQLVQAAASAANMQLDPEVKGRLFELAHTELEAQMGSAPTDARFPLFLALLDNTYGRYEEAKMYLEKSRQLSPTKQAIIFQQAANARVRGDTEAVMNLLKEAYELEPAYQEARIAYALEAYNTGAVVLSDELVAPLIAAGVVDQRLVAGYVARGDYERAARLWEGKAKVNPTDAQARLATAASYFAAGDNARAIAVLERLGIDIPEVKAQADALIADIKSGRATLAQ